MFIRKEKIMNKEDYISITNEKLDSSYRKIMLDQIDNYYKAKSYHISSCKYKVGDTVTFRLEYGAMLKVATSPYVEKEYR